MLWVKTVSPLVLFIALAAAPQPDWATPAAAPLQTARARLETPASLHFELDLGGLLRASWYLPAGERNLDAARDAGLAFLLRGRPLEADAVLFAVPVVGPLMTAARGNDLLALERPLLVASGLLEAVGVGVAALRLHRRLSGATEVADGAPVLSVSPIAAGHLGLSVRLTGF